MNSIRSWALTLSVILIVTGIVMKIVPENSTKRTVKFVASLIIITCFFRLDISAAVKELSHFDLSFSGEAVNELNENLQEKILSDVNSQIQDEIDKILIQYDKDAFSLLEFNDSKVKVKIFCNTLNISDRINFENELEKFFEDEIIFEYSAVR